MEDGRSSHKIKIGGIFLQSNNSLPDIQKTITLNTSVEKVWEAIATSQGIAAWWMPNTFEPVVNHEFILQTGHFGDSPCKITELVPMKRLSFNWGKDWKLTMEVTKSNDTQTEFLLIHSGWAADQTTEFGQPHTVIRQIMDDGWESILNQNLPSYLSTKQ